MRKDFFYFTYNNTFKWGGSTESHLKAHAEIIPVHKRARSLIASGYLKPGDICCWHSLQHINVYAGKNKWFDAGRGGTNGHWENFGHEDQDGWENRTYVFDKWGPVKTTYLDTQVDYIIRLPARTVSENGTGGGYRGRSDGIFKSTDGIDMGHRSTGGQRQLRRGVGRHQLCDEPDGISQVEIPWKHGPGSADCTGPVLLQQ